MSKKKIAVAEPRGWLNDGDVGKGSTGYRIMQSLLNVLMLVSLHVSTGQLPE